jgi:hypothetical protein
VVEPGYPLQGGQLDVIQVPPGPPVDDLGLVQAVDRSRVESCVGTDPFRLTRLGHRGPGERAVTVAGTRGGQQDVLS